MPAQAGIQQSPFFFGVEGACDYEVAALANDKARPSR
jgi:hypothetical protein